MGDALSAAAGLFTSIPVTFRRTLYGLFGLFVLLEGILEVLPEDWSLKMIALFGLFNSLMALSNSTSAALIEPADGGDVEPLHPDEFA